MDVQILVEAIALRNAVREGRMSRQEIRRRVMREFVAGHWSIGQLGTIVGYTSQGISRMVRGAVRPSPAPVGGSLHADCLDIALALYGAQTAEQRRNLIDECISTGTSTRLIARITGVPLSTVSYRKSRMKGTP